MLEKWRRPPKSIHSDLVILSVTEIECTEVSCPNGVDGWRHTNIGCRPHSFPTEVVVGACRGVVGIVLPNPGERPKGPSTRVGANLLAVTRTLLGPGLTSNKKLLGWRPSLLSVDQGWAEQAQNVVGCSDLGADPLDRLPSSGGGTCMNPTVSHSLLSINLYTLP